MKSIKELRSDCGQFKLPIRILQKFSRDYKLLDVGAGEHLLEDFLPKNIMYFSLDYIGEQNFKFDLNLNTPIRDSMFDIIICLETLEHTLYPHRVMTELLRIAKPNALFILSMPNEYNFWCRLKFLFGSKSFVQETFQTTEKHLHIHNPRVKDIRRFFSQYIKIEAIDYPWYSHHQWIVCDKIINFFAKIWPSMFARSVVVAGRS